VVVPEAYGVRGRPANLKVGKPPNLQVGAMVAAT
jgi:hypothetical protein